MPSLTRRDLCQMLLAAAAVPPAARAEAPKKAAGVKWNLPGDAPHLVCHYMPWFVVTPAPDGSGTPWDHWSWQGEHANHDPKRRLDDGRRDIASVYYPLIGPYNSWSRNVVRYHLRTMRAAGIEAVVVDWYGPGDYKDRRVPLLLDEAHAAGLGLTLCYEEKINFVWPDLRDPKTRAEAMDAATADMKYVLERYARHPAFLRRNGRPFFLQFNGYGEGKIGPRYFTAEEYAAIMARLPERPVFGRQGLEPDYATSADGRFLWWSSEGEGIRRFAEGARKLIDDRKAQFYMSFVSPGFDDTGVWGWNSKPRVSERKGLSLLRGTFDNAFVGGPELVQMVTWNDFQEGTVFEPTRQDGYLYLDALATWWAAKKGRPAPPAAALRAPFAEYGKTCSAAEQAELPPVAVREDMLRPRPLTVADPALIDHAANPSGV